MIELRRMSGSAFVLNSELILSLESTPDTLITLTTGEKIMVQDSCAEIVRRVTDFRKRLCQEPPIGEKGN